MTGDGPVVFDDVWLDDRRRCTWGLCAATFRLEPGSTVAVVEPEGEGGAEAIVSLLMGQRRPVRGNVVLPRGADRAAVAITTVLASGEQQLSLIGGIVVVTAPSEESIASADLVLRLQGGFVLDRSDLATVR